MSCRGKRFIVKGVLSSALDDPAERDALVTFFVDTILKLEITAKKINEQIISELTRIKFIGPGDSFTAQAARNKIALDGMSEFLERTFGSEWTERAKKDEKSSMKSIDQPGGGSHVGESKFVV